MFQCIEYDDGAGFNKLIDSEFDALVKPNDDHFFRSFVSIYKDRNLNPYLNIALYILWQYSPGVRLSGIWSDDKEKSAKLIKEVNLYVDIINSYPNHSEEEWERIAKLKGFL